MLAILQPAWHIHLSLAVVQELLDSSPSPSVPGQRNRRSLYVQCIQCFTCPFIVDVRSDSLLRLTHARNTLSDISSSDPHLAFNEQRRSSPGQANVRPALRNSQCSRQVGSRSSKQRHRIDPPPEAILFWALHDHIPRSVTSPDRSQA